MKKIMFLGKKVSGVSKQLFQKGLQKDQGIDGILVTVGLCVIALLLCVVMKDSLSKFITTIVSELTLQAKSILSGV